MCLRSCTEIRGQLVDICSLLLPCVSWGSISDCQALQQAPCSHLLPIAVINTTTKNNLERKKFNPAAYRILWKKVSVGVQARNLEMSLKQTWRRMLTGLLSVTYSVCFLIQLWTTCSGMVPLTMGWELLHQSLIKKNSPQICSHANLMEFLSWGSFFPNSNVISW